MKLKRRLMKLAAVSAATYLFDPTLGAQRRRHLKEKVEAFLAKRKGGPAGAGAPRAGADGLAIADHNGNVTPEPDPDKELVVSPV
ncbi:MAG: hypothetical protein R2755_15760 [Acidimicrobiales bacterium]